MFFAARLLLAGANRVFALLLGPLGAARGSHPIVEDGGIGDYLPAPARRIVILGVEHRGLVAVEAVISEFVSARLFPVLWENTAKFAEFCPKTTMERRLHGVNSIV